MAFGDLVAGIDRAALGLLGGVAVIYTPQGGAPTTVDGIFDDVPAFLTEQGSEFIPFVFFRLSDLPIHPDDCDPTITIASRQFRVCGRPEDGMGGIRLFLVALNV